MNVRMFFVVFFYIVKKNLENVHKTTDLGLAVSDFAGLISNLIILLFIIGVF